MLKTLITGCLLGGLLSGCDMAAERQQPVVVKSAGAAALPASAPVAVDQPARPLNLELSRDMLDQLVAEDSAEVTSDRLLASTSELNLKRYKEESRVSLNGRLFYDASQGNYIDAIDGGKIDIQIRFND